MIQFQNLKIEKLRFVWKLKIVNWKFRAVRGDRMPIEE
jgi:hypothetical protein